MKTELETIRELYRYNSVVRRKYLGAIWRLPARERYRDRGGSYPSLVDIYMHVLDAYRWWFLVVYERRGPFEEYPLGQRYSNSEAEKETGSLERLISNVLRHARDQGLSRVLTLPTERHERISVRDMLLHMAEEELQHRGEMNALLWQLDVDPPVTGFGDHR